MNYVTGEKIQELTDHSIIFDNQINIRVAMIQLNNTKCEATLFSGREDIPYLPEKIMRAQSLFVYTYALDMFFQKIYPLLENPFVLVTHNSDYGIGNSFEKFLNEGKIKRWYSQNINLEHPKLFSVPIGIANSQWPHGNLALIDKIRREYSGKMRLVYKNFDINTSPSHRTLVANQTKDFPFTRNRTQEEYLRDIASSKFNICPMGNGIDSHRMWETLYLESIPIVQNCINNRQYSELPIIMVDDWREISNSFLENKYDLIYENIYNNNYNCEKMDLEYWRREINKE